MSHASIFTNNLQIGYPNRVVQSCLTFSLNEGEMVCLLGRNGCGKSTLLRTLAGLQKPLAGTIEWQTTANSQEQRMALVLTERLTLDHTSIHDVVALGRYPYTSFLGGLTPNDEQKLTEALRNVGIDPEMAQRPFNALSDGEKQRTLIARALAQETPVILLDEPTAHLDLPHRILILQLLKQLAHNENKTILISTHELDLALRLSDRILLMSDEGIELDNAENLKQKNAFNRAFKMDIEQNYIFN